MEDQNMNTAPKDEKLWEIARKRARFKRHLVSYFLVNGFLWVIWALSGHIASGYYDGYKVGFNFPWPVIIMFFWGIGLLFEFFNTYIGYRENSEEKEYKKLIDKENKPDT